MTKLRALGKKISAVSKDLNVFFENYGIPYLASNKTDKCNFFLKKISFKVNTPFPVINSEMIIQQDAQLCLKKLLHI